jgi:uncharacterized DUF497 family protein
MGRRKNRSNIKDHGVDFCYAAGIFEHLIVGIVPEYLFFEELELTITRL